jgi:hypothetical protein
VDRYLHQDERRRLFVMAAVVLVLGLVFAFRGIAFHNDPGPTTSPSMSSPD